MINDKMISEGRQVAGLENAVDQASEGQEGWVANAKLECQECGKIFSKSNPTADTKCPGCGGYDIDLANDKTETMDQVSQRMFGKKADDLDGDEFKKVMHEMSEQDKVGNCTHCLGNGIMPLVGTPCPLCNAKEECSICSGTGYLHDKKCPNCSGTGLKNGKVDLDLYEQREFDRMTANGQSAEKALEILINTVEGDWSQLSTGLKRYAKSIGRSEGS